MPPADTIRFISANGSGSEEVFFIYKTKRGCFDKVQYIAQGCATLPVSLKSFNAARNKSNVLLKWETLNEEKNKGFDIQRLIGGRNWESVGFVTTKADNGNSPSSLNYEFVDLNNTKGISQYRLKQVDIDNKSAFSLIRSVRGEDQKYKTIVYPNPSRDGIVNVIFEDVNVTRDITVVDMNGRTIKQFKSVTDNSIRIDNLNVGFYSLRIIIKDTGEQSIEKIIINKR